MRLKKLFIFVCITVVLSSQSAFAWRAFGGGFKEQISASDIDTDTTNFNGVLSSADDTIQDALDTLDNISGASGPFILKNGGTTTTASIPFAQGLSVGDSTTNYTFTSIIDGTWPDTILYGQILVPAITSGGVKRVVPMIFGSEDTSAASLTYFRYQLASWEFAYGVGADKFSWYLGQDGAFTTRGAVVISAVPKTNSKVSTSDFELMNAFQTFSDGGAVASSMLGVRADVPGASVQINYNNPSGSDPTFFPLLVGPYQTGVDFAIGQGGALFWGDPAVTGSAALNATGQSYSKYPVIDYTDSSTQIPFDLKIYRYDTSKLGVNGGIYVNQDNFYYSQFGLAPDSSILSPSNSIDQLVVVKNVLSGQSRAASFVASLSTFTTTTYTNSVGANNGFAGTTGTTTGTLNITTTTNGGGIRVYRGLLDLNGTSSTITLTQGSVYTGGLRIDVANTTVTDFATFHSEGLAAATSSTTLTRFQDLWIRDGAASSGTFSTRVGIRIDTLTRATNNYAIFIAGTSTSSGIYFNSSTSASKEFIYSSGSNVLSINAAASITFDVNGGTEMTLSANTLTFESGATDTQIDFATSGKIGLQVGAVEYLGLTTTNIVLNETGTDTDTRIESDTNSNMFVLDAGSNFISIGQATQIDSATFSVAGKISTNNDITSTDTSDIGWSVVDQTDNQACNTGCTYACVFGIANATGSSVTNIVSCSDTTADLCVCAGPS